MSQTALTLILALIVVCVLGLWVLITLLLQAHRDAAVDKLVLAHHSEHGTGNAGDGTEKILVQQIQHIRITVRERHVLVGCLAALVLIAVTVSYFALRAFTAFTANM